MTGKGTPVAHEGWSQAMKSVRTSVKTTPWLRNALFIAQNGVHAIGDRPLADAADEGVDSGPARRLTAMVRVKDEARFLPEWLAHHTNVGVEHVVLYDNNSSDDTARAVAPFVTCVAWRLSCPGRRCRPRPQPTSTSCAATARRATGWHSSTPTSSSSRPRPEISATVLATTRAPALARQLALLRQLGPRDHPRRAGRRELRSRRRIAQPPREGDRPAPRGGRPTGTRTTSTTGGAAWPARPTGAVSSARSSRPRQRRGSC